MKKSVMVALVLSFFFLSEISSYAGGSLTIYLYGERFTGSYFVKNRSIYLDKNEFLNFLNLPSNTSFPEFAEVRKEGKTFVSLEAVARPLRSFFMVNWTTGIVDLYAPARLETTAEQSRNSLAYAGPIEVIPPSAYENVSGGVMSPYTAPSTPPYALAPYYNQTQFYKPYMYILYPYYIPIPITSQPPAQTPVHYSGGILPENSNGIPVGPPIYPYW